MPEPRLVTRAVVGDHAFAGDAELRERGDRASPESGGGDGLLVVVDLRIDESGPVVECGVEISVAGAAVGASPFSAAAMNAPAATGRDRGESNQPSTPRAWPHSQYDPEGAGQGVWAPETHRH